MEPIGTAESREPRSWLDEGEVSEFARDVVEGLSRPRKSLPSKHLYDPQGSDLFEAICDLPEYYPTRTETALLTEIAPQIAAHLAPGSVVVEYGSGASLKTRLLLDAAPDLFGYVPLDISETALEAATEAIEAAYPKLRVEPQLADFTKPLSLPSICDHRPTVGFFPGSTIGNFEWPDAVRFLRDARRLLGDGSKFILGADLVKGADILVPAYDDAAGVTAAFNLNLLARINRELGADFDLGAFRHRAVWNETMSRIEMHLESLKDQSVRLACGKRFDFAKGETIHTENCHKFTPAGLELMAKGAGWRVEEMWVSPAPRFAVLLLAAE
ncbi:MAG: hypothetical protein JWM33_529 [Caulobacteraceae bacterium]|nr:hypothetical protein [Caulobacteraceae bacterium]